MLEVTIFAGALLGVTVVGFFLNRSDFVETTAIVISVELKCEARKTHFRRLRDGLFKTERIKLPCISFDTEMGQGLEDQGYALVRFSRVGLEYRSPADNQLHETTAKLQSTNVSAGDAIVIGASRSNARMVRIDQ